MKSRSLWFELGFALTFLILFLIYASAHGEVVVDGATVTMKWTEPTTNGDGSPLTDLMQTWGTFEVDQNGTEVVCDMMQPASSPQGGGMISVSCLIPLQTGKETVIDFRAYAQDDNQNISSPPAHVQKMIDLLAPGSPTF